MNISIALKKNIRYLRIICIKYITTFISKIPRITDNLLVIAPHPDDEVLGCAGLIQKSMEEGHHVDVVIMSGGGKSHLGCCNITADELTGNRRNLSKDAARIIGLPEKNLHFLDYPDGNIDYANEETNRLKGLISDINPGMILIPHKGEGWQDHIQTAEIVKKLIAENQSVSIYEYCVWFWYYNYWHIDWKNARILKLTTEQHLKKKSAIDAYIKPLAPCGNPYSGVLPEALHKANSWNRELYFKVR